jgi:hypothetical protein
MPHMVGGPSQTALAELTFWEGEKIAVGGVEAENSTAKSAPRNRTITEM